MKQISHNPKTGVTQVDEVAMPQCLDDGALVKTSYSLISKGTESHSLRAVRGSLFSKAKKRPDLVRKVFSYYKENGFSKTYKLVNDRLDKPMVLGYSTVGEIVEVGAMNSFFQVGDRVACSGGGYATHSEINYSPHNLMCKVPSGVKDLDAIFTTTGAIAMHGIRQSKATIGENILVVGLGLIGNLTIQILQSLGCNVIGLDINEYALDFAKKTKLLKSENIFSIKDPDLLDKVMNLTKGKGVDKSLLTAQTTSDDPVKISGELLIDRGTMVVTGLMPLNIPRDIFYAKELQIKFSRSYGPGRYDNVYEEKSIDYPIGYVRWTINRNMESFLELIDQGKINPSALISHQYNVENAAKAYDLIKNKKEPCMAVSLSFLNDKDSRSSLIVNQLIDKKNSKLKTINIGYIGLGSFAQNYLIKSLVNNKRVFLNTVVNSKGENSKQMMSKYNFLNSSSNLEDVISSKEINTIFISSRHNSHFSLLSRSLAQQKNIYMDKPLCLKRKELEILEEAFSSYTGHFLLGYNRRFAPISLVVKEKLQNFSKGSNISIQYRINTGKLPANHWILDDDVGGGRIVSEVCHFIDLCLFFTNSYVKNVFAVQNTHIGKPNDLDTLSIHLTMENRSVITIQYRCNDNKEVDKEYLEIFSGDNILYFENFKKLYWSNNKSKKTLFKSNVINKGHSEMIEKYLNSLSSVESKSLIKLDEILHVSNVVFSILESIKKNKIISIN